MKQYSTEAVPRDELLARAEQRLAEVHWNQMAHRWGLDLDATARQTGALRRRRHVHCALDLLRLILVYGLCDWSLRLVGAWYMLAGLGDLSDVAVLQRLRHSGAWLGQLIVSRLQQRLVRLRRQAGVRLRLQDATVINSPGSTGTDWRVHLSLDLGALALDGIDITDAQGAETLARFPLRPGEIVIADRGYGFASSLGAALQAGSGVLTRIRWRNPPLVSPAHPTWKLVRWLRHVAARGEMQVSLQTPRGSFDLRLIAQRLPPEAAAAARRRVRRHGSDQGHTPCAETLWAAGFVLLLTNLPAPAWSGAQLIELYRVRWQIELQIKRLKSLLHLDHLRAQDPRVVQTYLLAKLLAALVLEEDSAATLPEARGEPTGHERPVSVWRVLQLRLEPLRQVVVGWISPQRLRACRAQLQRYLCEPPRRRKQQLAAARRLCTTLFTT